MARWIFDLDVTHNIFRPANGCCHKAHFLGKIEETHPAVRRQSLIQYLPRTDQLDKLQVTNPIWSLM